MGSAVGAEKTAARRVGVTLEQYRERLAAGERWCTSCKAWHPRAQFSADRTRGLRLSAQCLAAKRQRPRGARRPECEAARYAVNLAVRYGRMPKANAVPCHDCGHVWAHGERRHEYDHHAGYEPEHHLNVHAVCTTCHADRERKRRNG